MSDIGTKRHVGSGPGLAAGQERFAKAFILALAALAGSDATAPPQDAMKASVAGRHALRAPTLTKPRRVLP